MELLYLKFLLPGKPPLGGHILSHDHVEAAMMRKAGWEVWFLPDGTGSYEEIPTNLNDFVARDFRWLTGELQHLKQVGMRRTKASRPTTACPWLCSLNIC